MLNPEEFEEKFRLAMDSAKIHRRRKSNLFTFGQTQLPYYFAAESAINEGETLVRKGEIVTQKPSIIIQDDQPSFTGFGEDYENKQSGVLFGRMFQFPNLRYQHNETDLELVPKSLTQVVDETQAKLDSEGNTKTALLSGPEDAWALCLLIYAGEMTRSSAQDNINDMMQRKKFNSGGFGQDFL